MSKVPSPFAKKPIFRTSLDNLEKETKIIYYKSSGPGGQRKNKRETAIKLHHIPSGIWVIATEHRTQSNNKQLAFKRLQNRLRQLNKIDKLRVPTAIPFGVKEKILKKKKIHSEKKRLRKKVDVPSDY
ncbi:peptide chain release factor family protein [Candidatus Omnitrophota bacterium]